MHKKITFIIILLALGLNILEGDAQDFRSEIKIPKDDSEDCVKCMTMFRTRSADVGYGISLEDEQVMLYVTDEAWFRELISGNADGVTTDIVAKDQFTCAEDTYFFPEDHFRGYVMKPLFKKKIFETKPLSTGGMLISLGTLPPHLRGKELEFNLIILQNKYLCYYQYFYNIQGHKWDLLKTGLYRDSVKTAETNQDFIFNKRFEFEIPFEQNRYDYKSEDIKPIYDSLKLYNYNIIDIQIDAYSSIEGDRENNKMLQQRRAQSILTVLEGFQGRKLKADIRTYENWVDFFNDIPGTKYANWATVSKGRIKEKLHDAKVLSDLEPILSQHRKAILYLSLEKKYKISHEEPEKLVQIFNQAVRDEDIDEAMEVQHAIYQFVSNGLVPEDLPSKLEVPQARPYSLLLNNKYIMEYEQAPDLIYQALASFRKLQELVPDNPKVLFNICALEIQAWSYNDPLIDSKDLLSKIKSLKNTSLSTMMVYRLLINYYIIYSERLQHERKYREKDEAVKILAGIYSHMQHTADDALNIAKYYAGYRKMDWAEEVLTPYITDIRTPEDLLFYYINLTLVKPNMMSDKNYRILLENARAKNMPRFCQLFNSSLNDGVTFQLLNNLYLKSIYCENCEEEEDY